MSLNKEDTETIARIKNWLDSYPNRRGVVVLWDDEKLEFVDIAKVSGLHAVEFATKYKAFVENTVGVHNMLIEELE